MRNKRFEDRIFAFNYYSVAVWLMKKKTLPSRSHDPKYGIDLLTAKNALFLQYNLKKSPVEYHKKETLINFVQNKNLGSKMG